MTQRLNTLLNNLSQEEHIQLNSSQQKHSSLSSFQASYVIEHLLEQFLNMMSTYLYTPTPSNNVILISQKKKDNRAVNKISFTNTGKTIPVI